MRDAQNCGYALVDVLLGGCPAGDANAHGGLAVPFGCAAPAGPFPLHFRDDVFGCGGVAE
jgi:hypothetical protein